MQHKKPCNDCPWRRDALNGWTGNMTPEAWLKAVQGEATVECHVKLGNQCAGSSIYRANTCKKPRNKQILVLPVDRENVFSTPTEFLEHHGKTPDKDAPGKVKVVELTPVLRVIRAFRNLSVEEQREVSQELWGDALEALGVE
jgi:hypothetical protein